MFGVWNTQKIKQFFFLFYSASYLGIKKHRNCFNSRQVLTKKLIRLVKASPYIYEKGELVNDMFKKKKKKAIISIGLKQRESLSLLLFNLVEVHREKVTITWGTNFSKADRMAFCFRLTLSEDNGVENKTRILCVLILLTGLLSNKNINL